MIYLDHNATTIILPEVKQLMLELMDRPMNASSIHTSGRYAKGIIENARKQLLSLVLNNYSRHKDYHVIFTSSGTEANNLIMSNFQAGGTENVDIFISAGEHPSIYEHTKYYSNIKIININREGFLDLEHLEKLLSESKSDKKLVSVMLANNETGVIQDIKSISLLAKKHNAFMHSDCIQAAGKIAFDIEEIGLDFASFSAHKLGGPIGSAALIVKARYPMKPLIIGGGQERGMRSGTENTIAIAGFGLSAEIASRETPTRYNKMQTLQKKLEGALTVTHPSIIIAARDSDRLPNTSLIMIEGANAQTMLIALDLMGIELSSGSACSSGKVGKSHVLSAMGFLEKEVSSALRISTSYKTKESDIDELLAALTVIIKQKELA